MNSRKIVIIVLSVVLVLAAGYLVIDAFILNGAGEKAAVRGVVEDFGERLQMVSLLAPAEALEESMRENYSEFVTPALLEEWLERPLRAPGRLTSSPWPDRIEIDETEKVGDDAYIVRGRIVEVASSNGSEAVSEREAEIRLEKMEDKWVIVDVVLEQAA